MAKQILNVQERGAGGGLLEALATLTAGRTLAAADLNRWLLVDAATAQVITVPAGLPAGWSC